MKVKYAEVGKRLTELRKNRGLKQKECLEQLGDPTIQMLCSWEKGYSFPTYNYLRNICKFYNVSLDYLVFGIKNDGINFNCQNYSEIISLLVQLLDSKVFDDNAININRNRPSLVEINTSDEVIIDFYLKYKRLIESIDLYGEAKFNDALKNLIESYKQKTLTKNNL